MNRTNTLSGKLLIALLSLVFTGCIKDTCDHSYSYKYFIPAYKTTAEVRANIKSNQPQQVTNPGKLFIIGNFIFLNEIDKGIHVIDNGNPSNPLNVAFIDIPGNMDLAVNGNTLYADLYTDLVTIDITNPKDVHMIKVVEGVFPNRSYGFGFVADQNQVIVDWIESDTTVVVDCSGNPRIEFTNRVPFSAQAQNNSAGKALASPAGMGGSMARFALKNQHLYTVISQSLKSPIIHNWR